MIGRRAALAGGLAVPALLRRADARADNRKRIVMLLWRGWEEACDGFRDYLDAKGHAVEYIVRDAGQNVAAIPAFVREIEKTRPDMVFVWGGSTALAALGRWDAPTGGFIRDIPVVLAIVADPLGSGLIRSLEHPGRPVTGTVYVAPVDVQIRAMRAFRPFRRVATLFNPGEASSSAAVAQLAALATRDGFELIQQAVPTTDGEPQAAALPGLVAGFKAAGAEWLHIPPDTFLNTHRDTLTGSAMSERLPTFSATERFVTYSNGLAGLVCRYYNIGRFAGFKAEQILSGTAAADIPIETLSRFSLMVRMATARRLDFYPPLSMLRYAEAV